MEERSLARRREGNAANDALLVIRERFYSLDMLKM
jgi:hypothetical protein